MEEGVQSKRPVGRPRKIVDEPVVKRPVGRPRKQTTMEVLNDILGFEECATFEEFVKGEDYCNNPSLYDYWVQEEAKLPERCNELILDGSLGGGKSTFGSYYLAYRIYKMFHSGSPQKQLGIPDNSDIYCLYFSVSLAMAKKSGFSLLYDIFKECKWFKENCPINDKLTSSIIFTDRHFQIDFASDFGHQIGLNVWGFVLDEANFRSGVGLGVAEEYSEVTELYLQLLDRQVSRFACPDGSVDALAILISSASYQTSFSEQRAQAIKYNPNAKRITVRKYEVTPERYSKEKFRVFVGYGAAQPCIVESEDQEKKICQSINIDGTGTEVNYFMDVPINLKPQFEANVMLGIMNHCGVAVGSSSSFMPNMRFLFESYVDDIIPLFSSDELVASTEDNTELIEYFLPFAVRYPERAHSLFLDLSVSGDAGALVCYRYDGKDNRGYDIHTRVFSIRIVPPEYPAQTRIEKVKRLIIALAQYINIVAFGSDQYQSTALRQEVQAELGLDDIRISIDSSDVPHMHWLRGLVDNRIRQTADSYLEREVKEAVHDIKRHRVLKATKSTDDTLQANVGAFYISDTFGKGAGTLQDLYSDGARLNLIGATKMNNILKKLGYTTY